MNEVFEYGSPFDALATNFVTPSDMIGHLLRAEISDKNLIAYKAVCQVDKEQRYNNDLFPLIAPEQYQILYTLLCAGSYPSLSSREEQNQMFQMFTTIGPKIEDLKL